MADGQLFPPDVQQKHLIIVIGLSNNTISRVYFVIDRSRTRAWYLDVSFSPVNRLQRVDGETRVFDDESMRLKMSATVEIFSVPLTAFEQIITHGSAVLLTT